MAEIIQFIGLNELEGPEQDRVNALATEHYEKIKRLLNNATSLVIHIKPYNKSGHSSKYSIHVRALAPTKTFEADKTDWDLARAMHKVFKALEKEIEHEFHSEDTLKNLKVSKKTRK